ncbi:hypothetical protein C0993_011580 [Termitomyces sp. T159_Od127]|nr:hypothetical protein C0993_011580 [Termitomyces sp. T159_Od127]
MSRLVNVPSAGPRGGGFIPPPPAVQFAQAAENNAFPGHAPPTSYPSMYPSSYWPVPAPAPPWPSLRPLIPTWTYSCDSRHPSPYSYPAPAPSFGRSLPASRGIDTPYSRAYEPALGQPIATSPYFNRADGGFLPIERHHDPYSHSPGFYAGGIPLTRSRSRRSQQLEGYNPSNPAPRPKDFRVGYELRKPLIPINRLFNRFAKDEDPIKRVITDLLMYRRADLCISYDLRDPPEQGQSFPAFGRRYDDRGLAQFATSPPAEYMRIFHVLLPWYIDVKQGNSITVRDVVEQVFSVLQEPICAQHYFTEELDSAARERISMAFQLRTQGNEVEKAQGIKKIDYLEDKFIFVGLVRTWYGRWEMKTVPQGVVD